MTPGSLTRVPPVVMLAFLAPVWMCPAASAQPRSPRTVLAVHWSSEDFPNTSVVDAAIREVLLSRPGARVDYFAEYLESDRFPGANASLAFRDYIRRKYQGRRIDVVIANAEPALYFVLGHREELFPGAAVVSSTNAIPTAGIRRAGAGLTGVLSRVSDTQTLDLALKLHPSTERVFVVAQAPADGYLGEVRASLAGFAQRVQLVYISERSVPSLLAAIRAVPERSLILYIRHSQEDPGNVMFPDEVVRLAAEVSPVPVYAHSDSYIGMGVVGGIVRVPRALGTRLGEMARQILDGTPARDIPLEQVTVVPTFDWRQVRRWGIDPSLLPPGSDIRFRVPTTWESYRWYIIGALALVAFQGLMIASLVVQRSRRRESETRFQLLMNYAPVLIWMSGPDKLCSYVNKQWLDFTGRSLEQELGNGWAEAVHPDDYHRCLDTYVRAFDAREPFRMEYRLRRHDGQYRWVLNEGVPRRTPTGAFVGYMGSAIDITERKEAEDSLRASEQRYGLATSAGGVGVWDWNLETNEIYLDPSLKHLLGYKDDEITSHLDAWWRLVHPDDTPAVTERVQEHMDGKSRFYEVEYRKLHRDGSIRWFLARGSAVRRNGRAVRMIGTDTDITERKKVEQALHGAQAELARVSRLVALGEFATSIAHEVRQPLTAILANARACLRWLANGSPDLSELRSALWDVVDASRRADDVIRRNRELFTHHTVQKAPLDINWIIREVALLARTRLQGNQVALAPSLAAELPAVYGDRVELQQVLLNLVANAIDAMESVDPRSRRIELGTSLAVEGMVQVSVSDRGVGLEGVDMQRIFMGAYTTKVEGTGVGLSISRSIVEAHGGRLWAEQNPDRGATFFFTVPVYTTRLTLQRSLPA